LNMPADLQIEELVPNVKIHLLNIVKESLNNIRKHTEARKVSIEITAAGKEICAVIEDDVKGFALMPDEKEPAQGFGLHIMKERAREMGGKLRIDTAPGQGTKILLRVPQ